MNPIELKLNDQQRGAFLIETPEEKLAEMAVSISNGNLVVYHTEVSDKLKGKGVASRLLEEMVGYARENHLKVVPLCSYVHTQFKKHQDQYDDIWNKNWHA